VICGPTEINKKKLPICGTTSGYFDSILIRAPAVQREDM